ncbi:MAG: class I SAM-dependent methyltransferase [Desulfovibrionaceae bacterium]|nr:class I SAM-dependent methyltransferase [Desulfovibrionaceae bacterium]
MLGKKSETRYWDGLWSGGTLPPAVDPGDRSLDNHINLLLHEFVTAALRGHGPDSAGASLVEIGCAASTWLPYFARVHGMQVAGLDYSEPGCRSARAQLDRYGIEGEIHNVDLFDCPASLRERFDVAFSVGFVEHFEDPAVPLARIRDLLKPGGMALTVIPNLEGVNGWLTKTLNRPVYDLHVVIPPEALARHQEAAGLAVTQCGHLGGLNLCVVNFAGQRGLRTRVLPRLFSWGSKSWWMLERIARRAGLGLPVTALLSPYTASVAIRPGR